MNHAALTRAFAGLATSAVLLLPSHASAQTVEVLDARGAVVRTARGAGSPGDVGPRATPASPSSLRGDGPAGAAADCRTTPKDGLVFRPGGTAGSPVDPCGRVRYADGSTSAGRIADVPLAGPVTIDRMTTSSSGSYTPGGPLTLMGSAVTYTLSDGTSWASGAGSYYNHWSQLVSVEVSGTTIRYTLSSPNVGAVYEQTDYDAGDHSAQGKLVAAGPLVIEAEVGSTVATLHANARVASNEPTSYGEPRFNYYSAIVGSVVPIQIAYTISGATWQPDTFTRSFFYSLAGNADFAHPVSLPKALGLVVAGPSRVHGSFSTAYAANVTFDGGVTRNMTSLTAWSVDHPEIASISGGVLTVGALATPQETLAIGASFSWNGETLVAQKSVLCLAADPAEKPGSWPMFQANASHTGYVPATLRPSDFQLRWRKTVASGPLNPVAAGEGMVFATVVTYFGDTPQLFALRASDGATAWSKSFGSVFSVNPPSLAYGSLYVQTGKDTSGSLGVSLFAFDAATGDRTFQAPLEAQWERYFAPTVYDGKVYVNGGYYGGMYGLDAYSGARLWYSSLPQYDQWTPAVKDARAFAYVGSYYPGLYVRDRITGVPADFFVGDPAFVWNGWSMNLAPVIGAQGEVLAIHDGRLIAFDPDRGVIAWALQSQYSGQPSVASGLVYAVDAGHLVVLDEATHAPLWSVPSVGSISHPMIVTDSHVLVSTDSTVYAIDLATHEVVWSYPAGGHLALADEVLYIAGSDGSLTAIATTSRSWLYVLAPCRAVDTRGTAGVPIGGPALAAGVPRTLRLAGQCGVPAEARSVVANVTVAQSDGAGGVSLQAPGGSEAIWAVAYGAGRVRANNALLRLSSSGDVVATAEQAPGTSVHLIVDVTGYFK